MCVFIKSCDFRTIFVGIYLILFGAYLVIGAEPARANHYEISATLSAPSINLNSAVTTLSLNNGHLDTPDYIAGSFQNSANKTLIIGHSTTVFQNLDAIQAGDAIIYNDTVFRVASTSIVAKSDINMKKLLQGSSTETIVLMTCAGTDLGHGDATHRLLVTATASPLANVL